MVDNDWPDGWNFELEGAAADAVALHRELTALRALPRAVLSLVSTRLTMAAVTLTNGGQPNEGAAALHTARLLYVLAREAIAPLVAVPDEPVAPVVDVATREFPPCAECGHAERYHSPRFSSDASRFTCTLPGCPCVRVER